MKHDPNCIPWQPSAANATPEHALYDELVVGHVERFDDDGPTYAYCCGQRLGAFSTDSAARTAVIEALKAPVVTVMSANGASTPAPSEKQT